MDYGGWYDLDTKLFRWSNDIQFIAAQGVPSGTRNVTRRYTRHFNKIYVEPFDHTSLTFIFTNIVEWFFNKQEESFSRSVTLFKDNIVAATIQLFDKI
jgi:hypothetical protein